MRQVIGPPPGAVDEFTPEAFGNREDPTPVVVVYKVPTEEWKRNAARDGTRGSIMLDRTTGQPELDANGRVRVAFEANAVDDRKRRKALELVIAVRNYDGADGKPIDTGDRLWTHGEAEIVREVADHIMASAGVTTEMRGNFPAQSDSSPPAMAPSRGTAVGVVQRASPSSAGAGKGRRGKRASGT